MGAPCGTAAGERGVSRPLLLDLFCCEGGAAMGYHRAGFDVIGVDIVPQPRYPFPMVVADALTPPFDLSRFDVIHASPPCQLYTVANNIHGNTDHPDLVAPTRDLLRASGVSWIIENVPGAPLLSPVTICGQALGIGVKRHRLFESNMMLFGTQCPKGHPGDWVSVFGHTVLERGHVIGKAKGGGNTIKRRHLGVERGRVAMDMHWASRGGLSEAIPPAYTEFIGRQLIDQLERAA
jgi:DNA (cytosine-5)-methyltransferase 1